jgi:hypothetical protein
MTSPRPPAGASIATVRTIWRRRQVSYSAERHVEDGRAFVERGREDRHQFRFIVSAEDGVDRSDPRTSTRDLMKQMEADHGTKSIGLLSITRASRNIASDSRPTDRSPRPSAQSTIKLRLGGQPLEQDPISGWGQSRRLALRL